MLSLCAARGARAALRPPAARPLANYEARFVPRAHDGLQGDGGPGRGNGGVQPLRLLPGARAEKIPFAYRDAVAEELAPYLACDPVTPLPQAYLDKIDRRPRATVDFWWT